MRAGRARGQWGPGTGLNLARLFVAGRGGLAANQQRAEELFMLANAAALPATVAAAAAAAASAAPPPAMQPKLEQ